MRPSGRACLWVFVSLMGCMEGAADTAPSSTPPAESPPVQMAEIERPGLDVRTDSPTLTLPTPRALPSLSDPNGNVAVAYNDVAPWRPEIAVPDADEAVAARCSEGRATLHFMDMPEGTEREAWRASVRRYVRCVLGLDGQVSQPLDLQVVTAVRTTSRVTRVEISYAAFDKVNGFLVRTPATLYLPDTDRPVPAVLMYHGHGEGRIMLTDRPGSPENVLAYRVAEDLGYVVLAPDARSFGQFELGSHAGYWQSLPSSENGGFMGALARDGLQDMALLESLPAVDHARVGVAGLSMGAWRAIHTGLLHPELRAVVASGLFLPFRYLFSADHDGCQHVPALAARLSMEDLGATLAAQAFFVQWGTYDYFYNVHDAEGLLTRTRILANAADLGDNFVRDVNPMVAHQFVVASVEGFLRSRLGPGAW